MKRFFLGSGVILAFLAGILLYAARVPPMPARDAIPVPNGYDDFLAAAAAVRGEPPQGSKPTADELAAYTATNQPSLERLRKGLTLASLVPVRHQTNSGAHLEDLAGMKKLALLLAAEADTARQRSEWDRLVLASTQGMDFALRLARGGVMIDQMVATAAEAITRGPLEKSLSDIPATAARRAATALLELDGKRESFKRVRLYEEDFARRGSSWTVRIAWQLFLRRRTQAVFDKTETKITTATLDTRHLILNLAARAYTLDRGKPPASPSDLVPDYLPQIPIDPATGEALKNFKASPATATVP